MGGELVDDLLRIAKGSGRFYFELSADLLRDDLFERRAAVGRVPQQRRGAVQDKERRVAAGHDHHFVADHTGGNLRAAGDVLRLTHRISSHTRASGRNVNRRTGTCSTNLHAKSNTRPTSSGSCGAKNRMLRSSARVAS